MQIKIKYFASLREQVGLSDEIVETQSQTGAELFLEIKNKYQLSLGQKHVRLAINEEYADFEQALKPNDIIAFIPPVAGG